MKYIRIMNEAPDDVPRIYLEKLGISTKRDDEETIGQFGSGIKLAPIAAIRRGWQWIFAGTDAKSKYVMEYGSEVRDDGFNHVVYDYTDFDDDGSISSYVKETSFTVDAGLLSWDTSFQIFREALANAVDEQIRNNAEFSVDIVDIDDPKDFIVDNHFCVYLTADPELIRFVEDYDRYFLFERSPIHTSMGHGIDIYQSIDDETRYYHKGILVNFDSEQYEHSLFDYDFAHLDLNEERRIKSPSDVRYHIGRMIASLDDKDLMMRFLAIIDRDDHVESNLPSYSARGYGATNRIVEEAFAEKFGDKAVYVNSAARVAHVDEIKARGYTPVFVSSAFWLELFKENDILSGEDVTGLPMDLEVIDGNRMQQNMLQNAIKIVGSIDSRIYDLPEIKICKPNDGEQVYGVIRGNSILVTEIALASIEQAIATIVHEMDHYFSKNTSHDARFRDLADQRIGKLMFMLYESWETNK